MTETIWITIIICLSIIYNIMMVCATVEEVFKIIYGKNGREEE